MKNKDKHKKVENESRLYSEIMRNVSEGVYLIGLEDGIIKYANPNFEDMFGYMPGEMIGKYVATVNAPTDKTPEETKRNIVDILRRTGEWHGEVENIKKNGTHFWSYANVSLFDHPKFGWVIISVHTDITERKKAEKELRESEKRFRALYEEAPLPYQSLDAAGNFLYVNNAWLKVLGYKQEEVIGKNFIDFLAGDWEKTFKRRFPLFKRDGQVNNIKFEMLKKDGSKILVEFNGRIGRDAQGNFKQTHCIFQDITERKKAEEELKKEEAEFKLILDSSPIIVFYKGREGRFIRVNKVFAEALDMPEEKFVGKTVFDLYSDDIARKMTNDDQQVLESGKPKLNIIEQYESKQGKRWVQTDKIPTFDVNGKVIGLIGFAQDITERKKTEQLLKKERYYLAKAQEMGNIGTWELDIRKNLLVWTAENYRIFGLQQGMPLTYEIFLNCVHPDDRKYIDKEWKAALKKKPYKVEHRLLVNGEVKWVIQEAEVFFDETGKAIRGIGFTQDITERKTGERIKENLIRDVSHTLKTPIALARMACDIVERGIASKDLSQIKMGEEMAARNNAKAIKDIDDVLKISFLEAPIIAKMEKTPASLSKTINAVITDLSLGITQKGLKVAVDIPKDADKVLAINKDLSLLFTNIIGNAIKFTDKGSVKIKAAPKKDMVEIKVIDTGCGIKPTAIDKVFSKFYKRHAAIPGVGLGLSISKEIVNRNDGQIKIASKGVGKGTTVTVDLMAGKN